MKRLSGARLWAVTIAQLEAGDGHLWIVAPSAEHAVRKAKAFAKNAHGIRKPNITAVKSRGTIDA